MFIQKLVSMLAILALCGCASVQPFDNNDSRNELAGMFGLLEKSSIGYIFSEFTERPQKGETWVDLVRLEPTWPAEKRVCAGYGLAGLAENDDPWNTKNVCMKKEDREKYFYKKMHIDYTTPVGVILALPTIFTGGALALYVVPSTDYFDTKRYEQSVQQAWENSVENKGGMPFILAEQERLQQQARARVEMSLEQLRQERRQEKARREAMTQRIVTSGVGTQVCNEYRNGFIRIGYVEGIENDRIKVAVADIRYGDINSNIRPGGFQPGTVWDSLENWYTCHYR